METCLRKFFVGEIVQEVNCESCSSRSSIPVKRDFFKKQGVAKVCEECKKGHHKLTLPLSDNRSIQLPPCLVLQLQRVGWLPSGDTVKLDDFVLFPEMLDLSDFLFYQCRQAKSQFQSRLTGGSDSIAENKFASVSESLSTLPVSVGDLRYKYQLRSVVVHMGSANSGHFITYRRGTHNDQQWYYCSDTVSLATINCWYPSSELKFVQTVRKASTEEVLGCQAYLLFYERIFPPNLNSF